MSFNIENIQGRIPLKKLRWLTGIYTFIASLIVISLRMMNQFDKFEYGDYLVNIVAIVLFSIMTVALIWLMVVSFITKKPIMIIAIVVSFILIAISNYAFWATCPVCIEEAKDFFCEHAADYEYYITRPFQDKMDRLMTFCFCPYIVAAFISFASLSKNYFYDAPQSRNKQLLRYSLFFIMYVAVVFAMSPMSMIISLPVIFLQIISFSWRRSHPVLFRWTIIVYSLIILAIIVTDLVVGTYGHERGAGPVSFWYVVIVCGSPFMCIAYLMSVIMVIKLIIQNHRDKKRIHH